LDPDFDEGIYGVLGVENAVAAFASEGSTSPARVAESIERWKNHLR
jgi:argininosuccinate lyase